MFPFPTQEEHKQLLPFQPADLILDEINPEEHWIMGANTGIVGAALQEDGDWTPFCPENEPQKKIIETFNCTAFGYTNRIEILWKRVFNIVRNFSERALGIAAGTRPPGNSPFTVAEAARKTGLVDDHLLPFDESIMTIEQYYSPSPLTLALLNVARAFLRLCVPQHDWVGTDRASLREALKTSPIGITVTAWYRDADRLYYFPPGMKNNHDTTLVKINAAGTYVVYDSYPDENGSYFKTLRADCQFQLAMRYWLAPGIKDSTFNVFQSFIWDKLSRFLKLLFPEPVPPPPAPSAPPIVVEPQPTPKPMSKLFTTAVALLGKDASPKDIARDGVGCAESVSTIIKSIYPTFPIVTGTWSLWDALRARPNFSPVSPDSLQPGDIILCATGTGSGAIPNGHVGILGEGDGIMSNDSRTGLWSVNFTRESWHNYFVTKGGYPVHYFRLK
jgi:hypothetical protein